MRLDRKENYQEIFVNLFIYLLVFILTISRGFSMFSKASLGNTGFAVKKLWPRVIYLDFFLL